MTDRRKPLTRNQLAEFLKTPESIRSFEHMFQQVGIGFTDSIAAAQAAADAAQAAADLAQAAADLAQSAADAAQATADAAQADATMAISDAAAAQADATTALGQIAALGSMSAQNANSVAITGGTVSAQLKNNQTILLETTVALTDGAAAAAGTLLNAPAAGNPTKWIAINDNGTTRYIPAW